MVFSSKAIVVDIADDGSVAVDVSYNCKLTLEGVPKSQAWPRLSKHGFCTPGSKDMVAFKARHKGGIPSQSSVLNHWL